MEVSRFASFELLLELCDWGEFYGVETTTLYQTQGGDVGCGCTYITSTAAAVVGSRGLMLGHLLEADVETAGFVGKKFVDDPDVGANRHGSVVAYSGQFSEAALADGDAVLIAGLVNDGFSASFVENGFDWASCSSRLGERDVGREEVLVSGACARGHVAEDAHNDSALLDW